MNRRIRLRRTGILCLHCLRNAAYYRAWNAGPAFRRETEFWKTLNGNFIDICLLEWCKLYGDLNAKQHWSKLVSDSDQFAAELYRKLGMDETEFEHYRLAVRRYRDKFVAHLDELNQAEIPQLQPIIDSVQYLYDYLVQFEDDLNAFPDAPQSARTYYNHHLTLGRKAHRA